MGASVTEAGGILAKVGAGDRPEEVFGQSLNPPDDSGSAFHGFLMIRDGTARMIGIQMPAYSTADRVIDMLPDVLDRIDGYVDKYARPSEEK